MASSATLEKVESGTKGTQEDYYKLIKSITDKITAAKSKHDGKGPLSPRLRDEVKALQAELSKVKADVKSYIG